MLQELICSSAEVLPPASPNVVAAAASSDHHPTNSGQCHESKDEAYRLTTEALLALHPTVVALHLFAKYEQKPKIQSIPPTITHYTPTTNTKPNDHTDEYNILSDSHNVRPSSLPVVSSNIPSSSSDVVRTRRRDHSQINGDSSSSTSPDSEYNAIRRALMQTTSSSSKTKKRKIANSTKKSFGNGNDGQLIGIAEECEYDSDVGKFNCADADDQPLLTSSLQIHQNDDDDEHQPTEIAFQNNTRCLLLLLDANGASNNNKEPFDNSTSELHNLDESNSRKQSTLLCIGGFILTTVLLFLFPLPD